MSDDFDSLFDTTPTLAVPALPAVAAPAVAATQARDAAPEEAAAPSLWIALYRAGASVQYEGEHHTVNHVHISRNGLFVRLKNKDGIVPAEKVDVPLTRIALPMGAYKAPKTLLPPLLPPGPARTK